MEKKLSQKQQALLQWKEDHFGSSEGFEDSYGQALDWHQIHQDRFDNDTQDLY